MEKRIDMHIDLLRREEFREMECVSDVVKWVLSPVVILTTADVSLHRIHAQFDRISETYFAGFDFDLGERIRVRIIVRSRPRYVRRVARVDQDFY